MSDGLPMAGFAQRMQVQLVIPKDLDAPHEKVAYKKEHDGLTSWLLSDFIFPRGFAWSIQDKTGLEYSLDQSSQGSHNDNPIKEFGIFISLLHMG